MRERVRRRGVAGDLERYKYEKERGRERQKEKRGRGVD